MQTSTPTPDTISSTQRRGKIARLPRDIREQLNPSLDDDEETEKAEKEPTLQSSQSRLVKPFQENPLLGPNPPNILSWRRLSPEITVKPRLYPNPTTRQQFHHQNV